MGIFILLLALFGAFVTALPTASTGDGPGATIWTSPDFQGSSLAIPANSWCTNMNDVFGNFDGTARSLVVAKGYKCQFYTDYDCAPNGKQLDLGQVNQDDALSTLPAGFDLNIHSAYCAAISATKV